ncbi:hypothetical protein Tco_1356556, partial [Tanacetum coccineum]
FLNNQIENLTPTFNDEYDTPSNTKMVFANIKRQGKDFSGTVTPLFATMLLQPQADVGEVIIESLVKKKQKGTILELKRRRLKNTVFCTYTPYSAMKIRRISASSAQETRNDQFSIWHIHYNQYAICIAVHQSKICI